jgi:hypothetical protein
LRALLRGARVDEEIDAEFEHHVQERIAANIRNGMSESAARDDALRRFGDREQFRTQTLVIDESILKEQKRMEVFDTLHRELRQAVRGLWRAPGFALVAIITLALGIGASTAVYTLLDAVVLNPLPYPDSDRLVLIDHDVPGVKADAHWGVATATYFHYKDRSHSFDKFGAYWPGDYNLKGPGGAKQGSVVQVTAPFFDVLGARPALGRLFNADDDKPRAPDRTVLSYDYWQREFNGDRAVVGKSLDIEGSPVEIIGVLNQGFGLPDLNVDAWLPRRIARVMQHANWHHLSVVARLKPGVTPQEAQRDLTTLVPELPKEFPNVYSESFLTNTKFSPRVQTLQASVIGSFDKSCGWCWARLASSC